MSNVITMHSMKTTVGIEQGNCRIFLSEGGLQALARYLTEISENKRQAGLYMTPQEGGFLAWRIGDPEP